MELSVNAADRSDLLMLHPVDSCLCALPAQHITYSSTAHSLSQVCKDRDLALFIPGHPADSREKVQNHDY